MKQVTIQTWTEWLADRLRATKSPYADLYHGGLETQIQPTTDDDDLNRYTDWHIVGTPPGSHTGQWQDLSREQ